MIRWCSLVWLILARVDSLQVDHWQKNIDAEHVWRVMFNAVGTTSASG